MDAALARHDRAAHRPRTEAQIVAISMTYREIWVRNSGGVSGLSASTQADISAEGFSKLSMHIRRGDVQARGLPWTEEAYANPQSM